jgi:hypothetical protein
METPILFIIFNRPDTTKLVFEQIRKARPKKLFIAADGPRENNQHDEEKCTQAQKIAKQIDWPCELQTRFLQDNHGCGHAPSSAINWFFHHVDRGIILEDDCLPNQSFFLFCEKLLDFYQNDSRVMHIAGTSYFEHLNNSTDGSYFFSRIPKIWGWATWRRAWEKYDFFMENFDDFEKNHEIKNIFDQELTQIAWNSTFQQVRKHIKGPETTSVWDFQWTYTLFSHNGLCINPTRNLVKNIGFGENATHTKEDNPLIANTKTEEIDFAKFQHQQFFLPDKDEELWTLEHVFNIKIPNGIVWETKKLLKKKFPKLKNLYSKTKQKLTS